jgi:hypothetical protein
VRAARLVAARKGRIGNGIVPGEFDAEKGNNRCQSQQKDREFAAQACPPPIAVPQSRSLPRALASALARLADHRFSRTLRAQPSARLERDGAGNCEQRGLWLRPGGDAAEEEARVAA